MNCSDIQEKICPSKAGVGLGDGKAREKGINPLGAEQHTNDLIQTLIKTASSTVQGGSGPGSWDTPRLSLRPCGATSQIVGR